jgi:hypothetical protein
MVDVHVMAHNPSLVSEVVRERLYTHARARLYTYKSVFSYMKRKEG